MTEQYRQIIAEALEDADAVSEISSVLLASFENGEQDITLEQLALDSLARMELLVALETQLNVIVTPKEFSHFNSLNDIVGYIVQHANQDNDDHNLESAEPVPSVQPPVSTPAVIGLFKRAFSFCKTVAQLNKMLSSLEHRITPLEFSQLREWQLQGTLLPKGTADKYATALLTWLDGLYIAVERSGTVQPEAYTSTKLGPALRLFTGAGSPADKNLLVCFSTHGSRRMMMPHPVFLQYVPASQYDVLVVADPWKHGFRGPVPSLGQNTVEIIESVANLPLVTHYAAIRTIGCSAGSYPAVLAGYRLKAELTLGVGGRFPSEKHIAQIARMALNTWQASRRGHNVAVVMSHHSEISRDRIYARFVSWITSGVRYSAEFPNADRHHEFLPLLEQSGELRSFFEQTVFARISDIPSAENARQINRCFSASNPE